MWTGQPLQPASPSPAPLHPRSCSGTDFPCSLQTEEPAARAGSALWKPMNGLSRGGGRKPVRGQRPTVRLLLPQLCDWAVSLFLLFLFQFARVSLFFFISNDFPLILD